MVCAETARTEEAFDGIIGPCCRPEALAAAAAVVAAAHDAAAAGAIGCALQGARAAWLLLVQGSR